MLSGKNGQHFIMNELRLKFGKFFIILGVLSLVLFVFSIIAESSNSYFLFIGILLILFGTILRKKSKVKESDMQDSEIPSHRRGKNDNSRFKEHEDRENRQSRRSRKS